jgi:predicted metal-binding membrane protein
MATGYLTVWALLGVPAFLGGVSAAAWCMQHPALARLVPVLVGVVVLGAGALQFTPWKARHLACCRAAPAQERTLPADLATAWRHGLHLGLHCTACCAGTTLVLLALGLMDLRVMAVVTAAICAERLAPGGVRIARALGVLMGVAGVVVIARGACS